MGKETNVRFGEPRQVRAEQSTVQIFDPPMCCSTGLCGPTQDQTLIDINEAILSLASRGIGVVRYQMTTQPAAFLDNPEVMRLIREKQTSCLPITVVKGTVVKTGAYPSLQEIETGLNGDRK